MQWSGLGGHASSPPQRPVFASSRKTTLPGAEVGSKHGNTFYFLFKFDKARFPLIVSHGPEVLENCSPADTHLRGVGGEDRTAAFPLRRRQAKNQAVTEEDQYAEYMFGGVIPLDKATGASSGKSGLQDLSDDNPLYTAAAFYVANGLDGDEVSRKTGLGRDIVANVCRQQWFRDKVLVEMKQLGRTNPQMYLTGVVMETLMTLTELRDNSESDSVRLGSCKEILDRAMGKAPQRIEHAEDALNVSDKVKQLEDELKQMEA